MTQPTDTTTPQDTKPTMHDIDKPSTSGDLKDVQSFVDRFRPVPKDLHHSLHEAVSRGQLDVIRYLLEQGAPIDARIAWVAAFRAKSIPVFELLLEHAWDINAPVEGSKTALAFVLESESLVRWFLEHGADPNRGPLRRRPDLRSDFPYFGHILELAACGSSIPVFDLLLEHGAKLEDGMPLHLVAEAGAHSGGLPMMQHLLDLGVDINGLDNARGPWRAGTPLHCAVKSANAERVRFLLEHGADPHHQGSWGKTPLEMARIRRHSEVAVILAKATMQSS